MSYERSMSPARGAYDDGYGNPGGAAGYERSEGGGRGRSPRPMGGSARGGDEYSAYAPVDDPYSLPRRPRSPEEDRRGGKRRRSPSPLPARGDTYIPSYHRDRSPKPSYRDRRSGGDYYSGGGGGYGAPTSGGYGDRYDGRGSGGYGRDGYDSYGVAPPSSRYDNSRGSAAPPLRSTLKPPTELPYLATYTYYRDWMRDEDPRLFDDKVRLDESYEKYRTSWLYKHNRSIFDEVNGMSWCKEKYGIGEELVEGRKRLRAKGREGKMEAFLESLEKGELDDLTFDQKVIAPPTPAKKEAKLPEVNEEDKPADAEAAAKPEEGAGATEVDAVRGEGDATESTMAKKEEDDNPVKQETVADEEKPKTEDDGDTADKAEEEVKVENGDGANNKTDGESAGPLTTITEKEGEDQSAKKNDEDSIMVPGSSTTLLIKTLPPDLSRADLEAHCKQVDGFDYIALGEPNPTKKFHRIGWVVFKPEADMASAVEKLCESKINNFTLHMDLADKTTYQRLRVAPAAMAMPDRIRASLIHVKQIVSEYEKEAEDDIRGSQAIEAKLSNLKESEPAMKAETEDDEAALQAMTSEKFEKLELDLYVQYLRTVFHTCYYCVFSGDFTEELQRKCVKHVRRNTASPVGGKSRKENEATWLKSFDERILLLVNREKVDVRDYGGENYQDQLTALTKDHIQIEDDSKFRCKACKKLFKAAPFVEKHILNKHAEIIGDRLEELKYFNNFVLDPSHVSLPTADAPQYSNNACFANNGGSFYGNAGMANTFGAFNQMFAPTFGAGGAYGMMGPASAGYGAGFGGYPNAMILPPMSAGYSPVGGPGFNGGGYPSASLSGGARNLGDRIGDRSAGYGSPGNKRQRRDPLPPPKGAKIDPRAGRLHAYTDLDGPPASGGGEDDMMLDY